MSNTSFCFNCRLFAPGAGGHNELTEDEVDHCLEGECRRHPPCLGVTLIDRHGDEFRHFGEWPKVLGGDWCGLHEPHMESAHGG